jgi:hypothetical protein
LFEAEAVAAPFGKGGPGAAAVGSRRIRKEKRREELERRELKFALIPASCN